MSRRQGPINEPATTKFIDLPCKVDARPERDVFATKIRVAKAARAGVDSCPAPFQGVNKYPQIMNVGQVRPGSTSGPRRAVVASGQASPFDAVRPTAAHDGMRPSTAGTVRFGSSLEPQGIINRSGNDSIRPATASPAGKVRRNSVAISQDMAQNFCPVCKRKYPESCLCVAKSRADKEIEIQEWKKKRRALGMSTVTEEETRQRIADRAASGKEIKTLPTTFLGLVRQQAAALFDIANNRSTALHGLAFKMTDLLLPGMRKVNPFEELYNDKDKDSSVEGSKRGKKSKGKHGNVKRGGYGEAH